MNRNTVSRIKWTMPSILGCSRGLCISILALSVSQTGCSRPQPGMDLQKTTIAAAADDTPLPQGSPGAVDAGRAVPSTRSTPGDRSSEPIEEGVRLVLGSPEPEPTTTFELRFDTPIVSQDFVGQVASETPLVIRPELKGSWTWLSSRSGVFVPEEPLQMAQRYTLSLTPLNDAKGTPVAARLERTIQTPGLRILTAPAPPETNTTASPSLVIHFNSDVNPADLVPFTVFEDAQGRCIPAAMDRMTTYYSVDGYYANSPALAPWNRRFPGAGIGDPPQTDPSGRVPVPNAIEIKSGAPLPPGSGWHLRFRAGLPADGVATTLDRDVIFPLGDVHPLRVLSTETSNVLGARRGIRLRFNKAIGYADTNALARAISIEPRPQDVTFHSEYMALWIDGSFSLETDYSIAVETNLRAEDGTPLESKYAQTLRFSPVAPRLYFPDVHSWQQNRGKRTFDFLAINVPEVHVRAHLISPQAAAAVFGLFGKAYVRPYEERDDDDLEPYRRVDLSQGRFQAMRDSGAIKTIWEKDIDARAAVDETKRITLSWDEILGKDKPGVVLVELEAEIPGKKLAAQTLVQISDIGALTKRGGGVWNAWLFSNQTGEPLAGARVSAGSRVSKTSKDGLARLSAVDPRDTLDVIAASDVAVFEPWRGQGDLPPWGFDIPVDYGAAERAEIPLRIFAFTDRLVYQPGEVVHLKVIARELVDAGLAIPTARKAHVRVLDSHGRAFFDADAPLEKTGSLSLSVQIPNDALGHCSAQIEIGQSSEWQYFHVAHYQPDAFEVKIRAAGDFDPTEAVILPVACKYYFGKPLSGARVKWSLTGSDAHFGPPGFSEFGFLDLACEELQPVRQSTSEEGELKTGADGLVRLELGAALNASRPVPRDFRALVEVTDINQQTVSDAVSFTRHSSDFYLGLRDPDRAAIAGSPIPIDVIAVKTDGSPLPQPVQANARFFKIDWSTRNVEGAGHVRFYDKEATLVKLGETQVTSGKVRRSGGEWRWIASSGSGASFTPDAPGVYLIEVTASDDAGRPIKTARTCSVFGDGEAGWDYRDAARIDLEPDREEYRPGDTATILVKTPIHGTAIVTVEREKVIRSFVTKISRKQSSLKIPLTPEDSPNVFVGVVLIRGTADSTREAPAPEHRFGYCQLKVGDPGTRLRLSVKPNAETYEPGAEVTLQATAADASDSPVAGAEITLYAVDEGVLALMGYATPDPHKFFYAARPLGVESWLTLPSLLPEDQAKRSYTNKGFIIGDGGDFAEALRRKMLACAFWNASIRSDSRGRAKAVFKAPDSLTQYRVIAVASADARRFGSAESSFQIRKPLMLQPSAPPFARVNDRVTARALIQNETGADGKFNVSLEMDDRAIADDPSRPLHQTVSVPAGGATTVDFPVRFVSEGNSRWVWKARTLGEQGAAPKIGMAQQQSTKGARAGTMPSAPKSRSYGDAVETNIQISQPSEQVRLVQGVRLAGGTANLLAGADPRALEGRGAIKVTVANTPLAELADATDSLLHYPYGCAEQTASSLLPLVTLSEHADMIPGLKGRREELTRMARTGISRLLKMQTPSGGLSYWPGSREASPWPSAYGGAILAIARRAGQEVPPDAMANLHEYIRSQMRNTASVTGDAALGLRCLGAWALSIGGAAEPSYHQILFEKRDHLSPENRALLAMAIAEANGPEDMARELVRTAPTDERIASLWFDDPARDIAIRLLACTLANADPASTSALTEKLLDLRRNGEWRTTQGNAWAVYALSEFTRLAGLATSAASGAIVRAGATVHDFHLPGSGGFAESSLELPWSGPVELTLNARGQATLYARAVIESRPEKVTDARQDRGFSIARQYQKIADDGSLAPADHLSFGDRVLVSLEIQSPRSAAFVAIEDPVPCLLEAVNPDFKSREASGSNRAATNFASDHRELRGDKIVWFRDRLGPGTWSISYLARVRAAGDAIAPPARIFEMYRPERLGTSDSARLSVAASP